MCGVPCMGTKIPKMARPQNRKYDINSGKSFECCHAVMRISAKSNDTCIMHETRLNQKDLERYERLCAASTEHTLVYVAAAHILYISQVNFI